MTKKDLDRYFRKIMNEELDKRMETLKTQILSELRSKAKINNSDVPNEVDENYDLETKLTRNFLSEYKSKKPKAEIKYSNNSFLNELLNSTSPLSSDSPYDFGDDDDVSFNVIDLDVNGRPINENNPHVKSVMGILNRDYSELVKKMEKK